MTKPPMVAPIMPIVMVIIIPPGSGPGMAILASIPAMSPTTIQVRILTLSHLPLPSRTPTLRQYNLGSRHALL